MNYCIQISRGKVWRLRWWHSVNGKRVFDSCNLRDVIAEDRRHKDRKGGKLRIPDDVQAMADAKMEPLEKDPTIDIFTTIGEFVTEYLKDRKPHLKKGSHYGYQRLWERYLRARLESKVMRDFKRTDAFLLWKKIHEQYPKLSQQTLAHIRFFVSGVFAAALDRGLYAGENPAVAALPEGLRGRKKGYAYSVDEFHLYMGAMDSLQAKALIALSWGAGFGPAELAALDWTNYEPTKIGATIHVQQNYYRGVIDTTKTEARADDAKIGPEVCTFVDAYRESIGNPKDGLMFCYSKNRPINLQSFVKWTIRPALNRCETCGQKESEHKAKGHQFKRDVSIPEWKGWYPFRRGNATYIAKNMGGNGRRAAAAMLRHSDQGQTAEEHYIQNSKQERRALKAYEAIEVDRIRDDAAETIGQGIKLPVQ